MRNEVRFVGKEFPTYTTLIERFTIVSSLVWNEDRPLSEELNTVTTFIWFFSSVNSPVLNKYTSVANAFPTIITHMASLQWKLSGVEVENYSQRIPYIYYTHNVFPQYEHSGLE